jgi:hypothetical protein
MDVAAGFAWQHGWGILKDENLRFATLRIRILIVENVVSPYRERNAH